MQKYLNSREYDEAMEEEAYIKERVNAEDMYTPVKSKNLTKKNRKNSEN